MSQEYLSEALSLNKSGADLGSLIRFARAHDPTSRFRAEWGSQYEANLDEVLSRAVAALGDKATFAGSREELLLCMAHCVATAPYLGVSEEQIRARLSKLLGLLIQ